jgi:hypothetical protein
MKFNFEKISNGKFQINIFSNFFNDFCFLNFVNFSTAIVLTPTIPEDVEILDDDPPPEIENPENENFTNSGGARRVNLNSIFVLPNLEIENEIELNDRQIDLQNCDGVF